MTKPISGARKPRDPSSTVVAERLLKRESDGKRVRLVIYAPCRDSVPDWSCKVTLRVAREPERLLVNAKGIDGLQALVMALVATRKLLDAGDLVWLGEVGEVGLPLILPDHDAAYLSLIEAMVEAEDARQALVLKRTRKLLQRKKGLE